MKLSILICTTTTRVSNYLPRIINILEAQKGRDVEIIYLGDNKTRSVGKKRNDLISLAQGDYISFVDDDDTVSEDYIRCILGEIKFNPDVIVFRAFRHQDGAKDRVVRYSVNYQTDQNLPGEYRRIPNHLNVWKRSLIQDIKFKEINYGEDSEWALRCKPLIKSQREISKILYNYWFNSKTTETQNFVR